MHPAHVIINANARGKECSVNKILILDRITLPSLFSWRENSLIHHPYYSSMEYLNPAGSSSSDFHVLALGSTKIVNMHAI